MRDSVTVGIISDVHAQLGALVRAMDVFAARGVDRVVCAGDLVEKGPDGDAVVAMLRRWWVPCVQGNHDANAVRHAELVSGRRAGDRRLARELSAETIAFLAGLPVTRSYIWAGMRVQIAHGIPTCQVTGVRAGEVLPRALRKWSRAAAVDVLILGHTHAPMARWMGDTLLINPGSVCRGRTRDSHTCAILHLPGLEVEFIEL